MIYLNISDNQINIIEENNQNFGFPIYYDIDKTVLLDYFKNFLNNDFSIKRINESFNVLNNFFKSGYFKLDTKNLLLDFIKNNIKITNDVNDFITTKDIKDYYIDYINKKFYGYIIHNEQLNEIINLWINKYELKTKLIKRSNYYIKYIYYVKFFTI